MRLRRALLLILLGVSSCAMGQGQITVQVPDRQRYRAWIATDFPPLPFTALEARGPDLVLNAPTPLVGERVLVWNLDTGNLAVRDRSLIAGVWTVLQEDFARVATVSVRLPAAEGVAVVRSGAFRQELRLRPQDAGVGRFYGVPLGTLHLEFTPAGGTPVRGAFELQRDRSEPEPLLVLTAGRSAASDVFAWAFTLGAAALFSAVGWWAYRRLRPAPKVAVSAPQPCLVTADGKLVLPEGTSVLGRSADADLPLPDEPTLSRKHAEVVRQGGKVTVKDLGSKNGTFVNGVAASDPITLHNGDEVRLGAWTARFMSAEP